MKALFVCGTWNENGGKPSKICDTICSVLPTYFITQTFNGGYLDTLQPLVDVSVKYDAVIWFPNVSNKVATKYVEQIKKKNYKCLLVTSKRNDGKYSLADLTHRALANKANLFVEFKKADRISGRVLDPLGNVFADWTEDVETLGKAMGARLVELRSFTRVGSTQIGSAIEVPDDGKFFSLVRKSADIFHDLINNPANPSRFLGNASFRCQNGFPSFRGDNGLIYVSRRNVEKRDVSKKSFVAINGNSLDRVEYYGEVKPSVDTPTQIKLYSYFKRINYIIHGHVYLKYFPYSNKPIPCGAIEEFDEITRHFNPNHTFFGLNLKGHGFILLAQKLESMNDVIDGHGFMRRPMPEVCCGR